MSSGTERLGVEKYSPSLCPGVKLLPDLCILERRGVEASERDGDESDRRAGSFAVGFRQEVMRKDDYGWRT